MMTNSQLQNRPIKQAWLYVLLSLLPGVAPGFLALDPEIATKTIATGPWLTIVSSYLSLLLIFVYALRFRAQAIWAFYLFALGFFYQLILSLAPLPIDWLPAPIPAVIQTQLFPLIKSLSLALCILLASMLFRTLLNRPRPKLKIWLTVLTSLIAMLCLYVIFISLFAIARAESLLKQGVYALSILLLLTAVIIFYREYHLESHHVYFWMAVITTLLLISSGCLALSRVENDLLQFLGQVLFIFVQSGYLLAPYADIHRFTAAEKHIRASLEDSLFEAEKSADHLSNILQNVDVGIATLSESETFTFCNDAFLKLSQRAIDGVIDAKLSDFITMNDRAKYHKQKDQWQKGLPGSFETELELPSGTRRPVQIYANPVWHWGNLIEVHLAVVDISFQRDLSQDLQKTLADLRTTISEQKEQFQQARLELATTQAYYQAILTDTGELLIVMKEDGHCLFINDYARNRLGLSQSDVKPTLLLPFLTELKHLQKDYGPAMQTRLKDYPYALKVHGQMLQCLWNVRFMTAPDSAQELIVIVGRDVTQLSAQTAKLELFEKNQEQQVALKIRAYLDALQLMNDFMTLLVKSIKTDSSTAIYNECCRLLHRSGWELVLIFLPSADGHLLHLAAAAGHSGLAGLAHRNMPGIALPKFQGLLRAEVKIQDAFFLELKESAILLEWIEQIQKHAGVMQAGRLPKAALIAPMPIDGSESGYLLIFTPEIQKPAVHQVIPVTAIAITVATVAQHLEKFRQSLVRSRDLELANKLKTEFLANISHDLRTPLSSIMALSAVLAQQKSGALNEEQIKQINIIRQSGENLLRQINNTLDLIRMDAGHTDLTFSFFSVMDMVNRTANTVRPLCDEKKLRLEINIASNIPGQIFSDEAKISQALINLLSNAVKYTQRGKICIYVRTRERERQFCLAVTDTGPGMTKADMGLIFNDFTRLQPTIRSNISGTGLGMTIAQRSIELLGGSIRVSSKLRRGSSFEIILPAKKVGTIYVAGTHYDRLPSEINPKDQLEVEVKTAGARTQLTAPTVLIIDSDPATLALLKVPIDDLRFQSGFANQPQKVVEMVKNARPDGFIINLLMKNGSGWHLFERIRAASSLRLVPVFPLLLSEDKKHGLVLPKCDFISAPADPKQIAKIFQTCSDTTSEPAVLGVSADERTTAELEQQLKKHRCQFFAAIDARSAFKLIKKKKPDLIILDIQMPMREIFKVWLKLMDNFTGILVFYGNSLTPSQSMELQELAQWLLKKQRQKISVVLVRIKQELSHTIKTPTGKQQKNSPSMRESQRSDAAHELNSARAKILVIDDDKNSQYALQVVLEDCGHTVLFASSAKEALALVRQNRPDLIFIDMMMPVMDGYEATRRLRKLTGMRSVPIIAMTGQAAHTDKNRALKAGCNDYLIKPFNIEQLIRKIGEWLS